MKYLEELEILDLGRTNISNISFLINNKNIKEINLESSKINDKSVLKELKRLKPNIDICT